MPRSTAPGHRLACTAVFASLTALALAACSSGGSTANPTAGSTTGANGSSLPSSKTYGADMTAASLIASGGVTTDNSFCGTKPITLGIEDGVGLNGWSKASMAAVRSEAAKCPNVKQIVTIGQGQLQKAISDINGLVAQGANAMVVIPDFGAAELPAIQAATKAGVKVVAWAADPGGTPGKDYVAYVDWNTEAAGQQWATWMAKTLHGQGEVAYVGGPAGNPVSTGTLKGLVETFADHPGIKLVTGNTSWALGNWDQGTTQSVMSALLSKYPNLAGVITDDSPSGVAAARAFETAGRPLVPLATLSTSVLGCTWTAAIKSNPKLQVATISSRNWLGRVAARKAIAAAEGITDVEPDLYSLPLFEDSTAGKDPTCNPSASSGTDFSNHISSADLVKYGVTS